MRPVRKAPRAFTVIIDPVHRFSGPLARHVPVMSINQKFTAVRKSLYFDRVDVGAIPKGFLVLSNLIRIDPVLCRPDFIVIRANDVGAFVLIAVVDEDINRRATVGVGQDMVRVEPVYREVVRSIIERRGQVDRRGDQMCGAVSSENLLTRHALASTLPGLVGDGPERMILGSDEPVAVDRESAKHVAVRPGAGEHPPATDPGRRVSSPDKVCLPELALNDKAIYELLKRA